MLTEEHMPEVNHASGSNIYNTLAYFAVALFFANLVWSAITPWPASNQYGHSGVHVLTAGRHFAEDGFIACKFLPILQPGKLYPLPKEFYTHYPPLSDLLNGVLRKLGFTSLIAFRFPFIIAATLAALFWFLFIKDLYNPKAAFFCLLFLVILPEFYDGLISTYGFSLDQFCRFGAIYATYAYFNGKSENKRSSYIFLWLLMFFQSINTFEYTVYLQLFVWGYAFLFKRSEIKKLFGLLSAPALGLFLHLLQDIWAVGISHFINDLTVTFSKRAGIQGAGYFRVLPSSIKMFFWRMMPSLGLRSQNKMIFIVLVFTVLVSLHELLKNRQINDFHRYALLFFVCDISWYLIFPSHAKVNMEIIKTSLPTLTLFAGMMFYVNVERLQRYLNSRNYFFFIQSITVVSLFMLLYSFNLLRLARNVRNYLTVPPMEYKYRNLKDHVPEGAICFTNFGRDACFIGYYLDRRTYYRRSLTGLKKAMTYIREKPYFNKEKIYYVSFGSPRPELMKYLTVNAEPVYRYEQATIYKIRQLSRIADEH